MRRLHVLGVACAFIVIAVVAQIISQRAPAPLPEDRSDEFKPSDACLAEARAMSQKRVADYLKDHKSPPPDEDFSPPCLKRETDAWLFNSCLKRWNDDADLCHKTMKAITCLDQDQLDDQCSEAIEAVKQATSLQQRRPQP